jgi:hypothetical protein
MAVEIVLPAPPAIGERQTSNHDCGPAALASILQLCGRVDSEPRIAGWMTQHNLDQGGTAASGLAAYCDAMRVPIVWDSGRVLMSQYVAAALGRGHAVLGLHQCDGNANPKPAGSTHVAHWRAFYGNARGRYQTVNPWPPALEAIGQAVLDAADLKSHLEVKLPVAGAEQEPLEDFDVPKLGLFIARLAAGGSGVFVSDGMHFRHVPGPTTAVPDSLNDEMKVTGPWFNGDGQPLRLWNPNPVADVAAFGVPADAATATLLGLPFP